jgi:hypothetical protein
MQSVRDLFLNGFGAGTGLEAVRVVTLFGGAGCNHNRKLRDAPRVCWWRHTNFENSPDVAREALADSGGGITDPERVDGGAGALFCFADSVRLGAASLEGKLSLQGRSG